MSRPIFTPDTIKREMRANDRIRYAFEWEADRDRIAREAVALALAPEQWSAAHTNIVIKGKSCVHYKDFEAHLVFRTIARFLTRRFRVKTSARDHAVRGVIASLRDATPMWIIRRDIASFYESVPTDLLQQRLLSDTSIPAVVRKHLSRFFQAHSPNGRGLPRGVGLAAVLVEMIMEDLDHKIQSLTGVYRFYRYSDDMLIFCSKNPKQVCEDLESLCMSYGMQFNSRKSSITVASQMTGKIETPCYVEFLGYEFTFSSLCPKERGGRTVRVSIGSRRIKKLKTRIILSLRDFKRQRNERLLIQRLRFLSGNQNTTRRQSVLAPSKRVSSGLSFGYRLCGSYTDAEPETWDCDKLKALDGFMFALFRSNKSEFSSAIRSASEGARRELDRMSFFHGYNGRFIYEYTAQDVGQIIAVWRNVR